MKKLSKWFKHLSHAEQIILGFVVAALIGTTAAGLNNNQTPSTPDKPTSTHSQVHTPTITTKMETETQDIPFTSTTVENSTIAKGTTKITTAGVNGSKTLTYEVTYTDGKQTDKKLIKTEVTTQPVTQVTSIGTYVAPAPKATNCDPNYSGCVPIASDVDCAGGSGNGPAYVSGPIRVIGNDIYGLDRDGDGIACE